MHTGVYGQLDHKLDLSLWDHNAWGHRSSHCLFSPPTLEIMAASGWKLLQEHKDLSEAAPSLSLALKWAKRRRCYDLSIPGSLDLHSYLYCVPSPGGAEVFPDCFSEIGKEEWVTMLWKNMHTKHLSLCHFLPFLSAI